MTALEQFNALNGTKAYRKDLENILQKAKDENNASLVYRISKTLNAFPDVNSFEIEIISYPEAPQGLSGAQHSGDYKEALDDCGRLRKGWKFVKGNVVKIQKKEKPKKESKPKKETEPVKSKEENNSKKETKKDKKYKFVVITDNRPSRVIAVFSYTNPNIKDLRESFWKNGEGKYYETTEEGLRNYTFGMGVYPFEEAKKHIEEKYTEGKDFIYFIIEKDGGRDEAISLVEKPKKETDKTAIDEIKKIVQERLKNQGKPRLYEVLHLESAKGIFIFSWSDLGNIDGTKKKENALAKGLYQYTFPKFKNTQEKIEFSNQVWYDLLINKSLTLKRDIKEPTLNIINLYLGKNTIEDIESTSKKTSEEAKPKKGKTPKIKDFEAFDNLKSQLVAENADIPKNEVLEFLYNFVDRFEEGKTKYQFWNTPDNRPSEAVLQYKKHPFLNRIQNPSAKMRAYELTPRGYKLVEKFYKGIEHIKNTYEYKFIVGIHKLDGIFRDRKNYAEEQENVQDSSKKKDKKDTEKATKPVKTGKINVQKASNFSLLQEPTKVLLKFSKDTDKEYYKKYTDEKGFVGVDFLKDNLKDLKKQAIIDEPQGFINTEDFEKSHKASKIKGIDSLKTIVSKDKLYPYLQCVFIEPDTYVATDALKIVVLNRPKNDGLKTGAFYDPNFKCEKLGGCSKEEFYKDLERGFPNYKGVLFPKPKYFTEWIPLEPLIKHLKTGLEVLTKISGLKRVFTIAIKSNIEEKRFDIKNLLDALLVLESNEAKKIRIEAIDEFGKNRIQIKTDNNNLAVIMPLNTGNKSSDVISPLKIAPIQLEFILNETEEKTGLNAPITEVSTERFKNMKVSELRAFTLEYYLSHLKGKKVAIKNHLKEVVFTTKAGRKIAKGEAMYSEKAAVIEHLEELIKNSTYNNWGDRKDSDGKDVLGYLNFKSKITIDGEKRHLRIAISVDNERNLKLKSYDIGKEKSESTHKGVKPSSGQVESLSEGKDTKKSLSRKEKDENLGLNAPRHEGILKEALNECGRLKKGWKFEKGKAVKVDTKKGKDKEGEQKELDLYMQEMKIAIKKSKAGKFDKKNILSWLSKFPDKIKGQLYSFLYHNYLLDKEEAKLRKSKKSVPFSLINTQYDINKFVSQLFDLEKEDFFDLYFFFIYNMDECIELLEDKEVKKNYYEKKKKGLSGVNYSQALFDDIGLNAPRHEGILKEALTEKGKLKKGWYFQDYGIIDPKGEYFTLERETSEEYEIIKKVLDDKNSKINSKINEKIYQKEKQESADRYSKEQSLYLELYEKNNFSKNLTYDYFVFFLSNGMKGFGINEKYSERSFILNTNSPIQKKYIKTLSENNLVEDIKLVEKKQISGRVHYQYQVFLLSKGISLIKKYIKGYREIYNYDENLKKNKQKYGLSMPFYVQEQEKKEIQPSSNSISNKIKAFQGRNFEIFNIENPDLSTFLGEIERKNIGSTVITLTGGAGSGKTRFAFQFMNALAQNYKVGHASLEEHPESKLYFDKVTQYLDSQAQNNISVLENETLDGLENLINENEVIVIDSFAKLREMDSKFLVDKDLRKKYNGKLFLVIFQQTSDGKMRGGSTSEFDGDIILFTKTFDDPKENFVYPSKNRYNALPLSELKYSVFYQQLLQDEEQEQPVTDLIFDVVY